jgi:hypothetical protein
VETKSDLRLSNTLVAPDMFVTGVNIDILETLLDRTENDLPPPADKIAEAPSIMEISSLMMDLVAKSSSLAPPSKF